MGPGVDACVIKWGDNQPVELQIDAMGALLLLTIVSPDFGKEKREEVISLRTKKLGPLQRNALVSDETYGITIDSEVDRYLLQADPLIVTIKSIDYSFAITNTSSAMDAVRRCVGQPTRAEMQAKKAPAYPVPDGWRLLDDTGNACTARLDGNEIDTMVSINNSDQVLLIAGRKDWNTWGGNINLTLRFDSEPPRPYSAWVWNNLVMLLLTKDEDVATLRKAFTLKWVLPRGEYSTRINGIAMALDSVTACTKEKRKTKNAQPPAATDR
jgi:Tfp pilus assembly protein PilZ